jgi:protein-S-isoprenylcysteine O-methyltransferase Ste14
MTNYVLKVLPPIWFVTLFAAALVAHFAFPASRVFDIYVPIVSPTVGMIIAVGGFILSNIASSIFAREKTEILPTSPTNRVLITEGPYRYTRNPMYLGMFVLFCGVGIALGSLPMFVAAALDFIILNFFFVPFEEAKMERIFGDSYRAYKAQVRRWL